MRTVRLGWVCLLGLVALAGCGPTKHERGIALLGSANQIVTASIDNMGWSRPGAEIRSAHFTAIVTTYDEAGKSFTDRQEMAIDLVKVTITATGGTPQGTWTAQTDEAGQFEVKADKGVNVAVVTRRMAPTLLTLLRRIRGPYNLLGDERPRTVDSMRVAGQDVVRVSVGGDTRQAVAYYFDSASGILRYVTALADRPAAKGTVTDYQYQSLPNGVLFPSKIKVAHLGQFVLIGEKPICEVEISHVTF